jgi:hypothetical protein
MELINNPEAAEKFRDALHLYFKNNYFNTMITAIMSNNYTEINKGISEFCSKIPVDIKIGNYFFYGNFPHENINNMNIEHILNIKSVKYLLIKEIIKNSDIDNVSSIMDEKEEFIITQIFKNRHIDMYMQDMLIQNYKLNNEIDRLTKELNRKNLELAAIKSSSFEPGKMYVSVPVTPPGLFNPSPGLSSPNTSPVLNSPKDFDSSIFGIIPNISPSLEFINNNIWKF